MTNVWRLGCSLVTLLFLAGCGGGTNSTPDDSANSSPSAEHAANILAESIDSTDESESDGVVTTSARSTPVTKSIADDERDTNLDEPDKDSPEAFILQITQLKLKPLSNPSSQPGLLAWISLASMCWLRTSDVHFANKKGRSSKLTRGPLFHHMYRLSMANLKKLAMQLWTCCFLTDNKGTSRLLVS